MYTREYTPSKPREYGSISDSFIEEYKKETGLNGFSTGMGKGVLSSIKGFAQLGENVGQGILGGVEKLTGLPLTQDKVYSEEAIQESADKGGLGKLFTDKNLEARGGAENVGKFVEQVAEYAIPGSKVSKMAKGINTGSKIAKFALDTGAKALTSGTVASIKEGDIGKEAAIAAGTEVAFPLASELVVKPVFKFMGRLVKGMGAGLGGTSSKLLDEIITNPEIAKEQVKKFVAEGGDKILSENSRTIMNGIASIKKEARAAYGAGVEALKETDIKPKDFRDGVMKLFDDYGSVVEGNTRVLNNVDFRDAVNIKRASTIFDKIQNVKLDGKSLKSLIDTVDNMVYKNPGTPEGISFNLFAKDVSNSLKNIINKSTDVLGDMNASYAKDMQMTNALEDIFTGVKFNSPNEIGRELNRISQQLETLFSKKGLSPKFIDAFLDRIGVSAKDFKTSEAVRQISSKGVSANGIGSTISEISSAVTSSLVPPEVVRDIAIRFGKNEQVVKQAIENIAPSFRATFIQALNSLLK